MSISDSGLVVWQPLRTDEGVHQIIINVNDGLIDVKQEYRLLVEGPPTITIADSLAISVEDTLQLTHKNFKKTSNLTFQAEGLPESLYLNESTGTINWASTIKGFGLFDLTVTIQNETELAEKTLKLFVYQNPHLNLNAPTEAYAGFTYVYDVQAFDMFGEYIQENGGEIHLKSETMLDIKYDIDTHTIKWIPSHDHVGEHQFTVAALDQFGLTASVTHYVNVFISPCGELDDKCGVCGGDGSDDLGCGCFEPAPSGCDNTCGSTLVDDTCGVCGGDGLSCLSDAEIDELEQQEKINALESNTSRLSNAEIDELVKGGLLTKKQGKKARGFRNSRGIEVAIIVKQNQAATEMREKAIAQHQNKINALESNTSRLSNTEIDELVKDGLLTKKQGKKSKRFRNSRGSEIAKIIKQNQAAN